MDYTDQMPPLVAELPLTLLLLSAAAGILMMALFRMASNPIAIRQAKRKVQAQLLALRLFGDEPALVWRAQHRLLTANLRYLAVMLAPIAVAAVPFVLGFPQLEALYGRAAVPVGGETILTMRLRGPIANPLPEPRLEMPSGLSAETPGVRVQDAGEISWRLRADGPVSAPVHIRLGDADVTKSVQVGTGRGYLAETREASALAWLTNPGEAPIRAASVESVHITYRGLRYFAFGLEWPWEAWFLVISAIVALVAMKPFGVVF